MRNAARIGLVKTRKYKDLVASVRLVCHVFPELWGLCRPFADACATAGSRDGSARDFQRLMLKPNFRPASSQQRNMTKNKPMQDHLFPPLRYGQLHSLLGHLLRHATLRGQAAFGATFRDETITPLQYMIAELIYWNGATGHGDVGRAMGTSKSVITNTVKPMLEDGRLVALGETTDRRTVRYQLTDEGRAWFESIRNRIKESEALLANHLTAKEQDELGTLLRKLLRTPQSER